MKRPYRQPQRHELLTISDLMALTGESEAAWRKRLGRKELAYVKCGANTRVARNEILRWLTDRLIVPIARRKAAVRDLKLSVRNVLNIEKENDQWLKRASRLVQQTKGLARQ